MAGSIVIAVETVTRLRAATVLYAVTCPAGLTLF
jgi:hypothetical protein